MVSIPYSELLWFVSQELELDSESKLKEERRELGVPKGLFTWITCRVFCSYSVLCQEAERLGPSLWGPLRHISDALHKRIVF